MEGTVKLPLPEPPELDFVGELDGCAEACVEVVARADGVAAAECVTGADVDGAGEVAGAEAGADAGAELPPVAKAAAEPPEAGADAAEVPVEVPPHAVRPAPPMTMAMIATGTRDILMLLPFRE